MSIRTYFSILFILMILAIAFSPATAMAANQTVHDTEHQILRAQHGERWAKEDAEIDVKLAAIRNRNGGKPPNFVYVLLDDFGFGEIGMPDLDVIRGYSTRTVSRASACPMAVSKISAPKPKLWYSPWPRG